MEQPKSSKFQKGKLSSCRQTTISVTTAKEVMMSMSCWFVTAATFTAVIFTAIQCFKVVFLKAIGTVNIARSEWEREALTTRKHWNWVWAPFRSLTQRWEQVRSAQGKNQLRRAPGLGVRNQWPECCTECGGEGERSLLFSNIPHKLNFVSYYYNS